MNNEIFLAAFVDEMEKCGGRRWQKAKKVISATVGAGGLLLGCGTKPCPVPTQVGKAGTRAVAHAPQHPGQGESPKQSISSINDDLAKKLRAARGTNTASAEELKRSLIHDKDVDVDAAARRAKELAAGNTAKARDLSDKLFELRTRRIMAQKSGASNAADLEKQEAAMERQWKELRGR